MAVTGHNVPLLPAHFVERELNLFFAPCFLMKIQDNKFRWYVWMNLLMEIFNILKIIYFEHTLIASVTEALFEIDSQDFDTQSKRILAGFSYSKRILTGFWYLKRILTGFAVVKSYLIKRKPKRNFNKLLSKNIFQFFYQVWLSFPQK